MLCVEHSNAQTYCTTHKCTETGLLTFTRGLSCGTAGRYSVHGNVFSVSVMDLMCCAPAFLGRRYHSQVILSAWDSMWEPPLTVSKQRMSSRASYYLGRLKLQWFTYQSLRKWWQAIPTFRRKTSAPSAWDILAMFNSMMWAQILSTSWEIINLLEHCKQLI